MAFKINFVGLIATYVIMTSGACVSLALMFTRDAS